MGDADSGLASAEEILGYAEEEFEKALKIGDMLLYRNAVDKAFLSMIVAVNSYLNRKLGITPKSHGERRSLLRKVEREDLRALYSDAMKTLHDEAFHGGVYNPDEAKYAITLVRRIIEESKKLKSRLFLRNSASSFEPVETRPLLEIPQINPWHKDRFVRETHTFNGGNRSHQNKSFRAQEEISRHCSVTSYDVFGTTDKIETGGDSRLMHLDLESAS